MSPAGDPPPGSVVEPSGATGVHERGKPDVFALCICAIYMQLHTLNNTLKVECTNPTRWKSHLPPF